MTDYNEKVVELKVLRSKKAKAHSDMDDAELAWKKATLDLGRAKRKKDEWEDSLLFFFNTEDSDFSDESIAEQAHPYIDAIEKVRELITQVDTAAIALKEKRELFAKAEEAVRKFQYKFFRNM